MNEYKLRPIKFLWQLLNRTISEAKVYILGYRSYTALLTQTGTDAPVATVLENTIGDIVWTRDSDGLYKGSSNGLFTINKTALFINNSVQNLDTQITFYQELQNEIWIETYIAGVATDDLLLSNGQGVTIEIRVYN